ncbi:glycosyltransferase family 4 protein [Gammaproteobacteria bacterium]|nr:glycosyltransferase family 4 protein [Gammaproteobacteria bacterium]
MLTKYDDLGASSRMRLLQYIPAIERAGHSVTVAPLLSNNYIKELQNNQRTVLKILWAYIRRIRLLVSCRDADLIWIEKECFPWIPAWFERMLLPANIPYVLDYDDAVFHLYDQHNFFFIRALLKNKHFALIQRAASVIVGNNYLYQYASKTNNSKIFIVPTAIDLDHYDYAAEPLISSNFKVCFGWIGQESTAYNLLPLSRTFTDFADQYNVFFSAIGIDADRMQLPMKSTPWSFETEVAELKNFDVGMMPLENGVFERGKCGYKLIQYMASGLPVIASPVGVNNQIVQHGINGFLVDTLEEWQSAILSLILDPQKRYEMGCAGRKIIEQEYCIQVTAPTIIKVLETSQER